MNRKVTIWGLCGKARKRREVNGRQLEALVGDERRFQPQFGGRKPFRLLSPKLAEDGIQPGRAAAKKAIDRAVWSFNSERPHTALRYNTPAAAYSRHAAA